MSTVCAHWYHLCLLIYHAFELLLIYAFGFSLFRHFLDITFQLFKLLGLAKDHWRGLSTRNAHIVHIVN